MGQSVSQSAASAYYIETGRLESFGFFGTDPPLLERGIQDGVDSLYVRCAELGQVMTAGGKGVDHVAFIREARDRWGEPYAVVRTATNHPTFLTR